MKIRSVKFTAKQTLCLMISLAFGSLVLVEISWYGSRYGDRPAAINNQQWKYVSNLFIGKAWTRKPISTEGKSSSECTHDPFMIDHAQLSNLWQMPNSVSKEPGYDVRMCGSSGRIQWHLNGFTKAALVLSMFITIHYKENPTWKAQKTHSLLALG